ncbi:MAG: DUF4349 domain-containing protein [Nitrososphaeria archaeon]|nr:DUF4349 domain-containing protein [Nitrososphaeria archaeon]NIN52622.1 DUF4349 domain-containing protein [Nitrososphaeria archaeon]NIQ33097.1 DUF4349 domain-containing protein [Nitrososphaeria archaeon]
MSLEPRISVADEKGVSAPTPLPSPAPESTPVPLPKPSQPPEVELTGLEAGERMVIYTSQVSVEVEDVDAAINEIQSIAEGLGGFVEAVSVSGGQRKSGYITIRVPQEEFYSVIRRIEGIGNVTNKEVLGKDVTEQYIDLEARLNNAKSEEERLLAILEKATEVKDILLIEKELMRVRETIERLTGQLQYLESRVAYSTISIYLEETSKPPLISDVKAVDIATTRAAIKWTTDVSSTSLVEYGTTENYGWVVSNPKLVRDHVIYLTGLEDSTKYHYRVKSTAYEKTATSSDFTFTTASEPWIKIPDVDWGSAIEGGLWGLLILAQGLIMLLIILVPLALVISPPIYYLYRRRQRKKAA